MYSRIHGILEGDFKSLTDGISPDVVESTKMLVKYVLDNGNKGPKSTSDKERMEKEMVIKLMHKGNTYVLQ